MQNTNEGKTDFVECNALLKLKFRRLHERVVENVNADDVVDFLFEKGVLGPRDSRALQFHRNDQQQQCRELLVFTVTPHVRTPEGFYQPIPCHQEDNIS